MANIYKGKASKVEHAATNSWPGTDLGEMADVLIEFESMVFEGLADDHPVGGMGKAKIVLAEATSARRSALEALINEDTYIRVTDTAGNYHIFHGPLTFEESRNFDDPTNPHVFTIDIERYADDAEDWCPAPAD